MDVGEASPAGPPVGRIREALDVACRAIRELDAGDVDVVDKSPGEERFDPVTAVDLAVDRALRDFLPAGDEGWLSEESADDRSRLDRSRVWVVDPLDGTREFVDGVPEWCVSIGLVEDGEPVAGGIVNPATGEEIVGGVGAGVWLNGERVDPGRRATLPATLPVRLPIRLPIRLEGATVLASRSEIGRGEWDRYEGAAFRIRPCGSVAYKLGLVAAGLADATWTLTPKNEWDVAAGAALCRAAGLAVMHADGSEPTFNREDPLLPDFLAGPEELLEDFRSRWL